MLNHAITLFSAPTLVGSTANEGFVGSLVLRARALYRYNQALRELGSLDQRDLDDMAIGRADFPALAHRHATGADPIVRLYH